MTDTRSLPELLDDVRFAMVTTSSPEGLSSRPVTCVEATADSLSFLVDRTADWVSALEGEITTVNASFADPGDNIYISVSGIAKVVHDPAEVARLWTPTAKAFFDGPEDPNVSVLRLQATSGQWWDGPSGRLRQAIALVKTAVTRDHDDAGDMGRIAT